MLNFIALFASTEMLQHHTGDLSVAAEGAPAVQLCLCPAYRTAQVQHVSCVGSLQEASQLKLIFPWQHDSHRSQPGLELHQA